MADFSNYPEKYLLFNAQQSKNLALVMQIEGVDDLYGISPTFTQVRYGDAGIVYGLPGLVYGGLRRVDSVKPYIILDSGMTIGQRIEPEQGKGNIGTLTMTLIDKNGEVSRIIAPGVVVDEIMAKREVRIWLGYAQTSYPEDYLLVYRGYITSISCPPGLVRFQISDSTSKKRQALFSTPTTNLANNIDNSQTNIPVDETDGFYQAILGPDGNYDDIVRTYIKIDSEWMEYEPSGLAPSEVTVTRGGSSSLGTTPTSHEIDATVYNGIQLGGNVEGVNPITLALKLLLSGWAGDCETGIEILSFVYTYNEEIGFFDDSVFVLRSDDAKTDLGLTVGDYFTITGASESGNNVTGIITDIVLLSDKYQIIYTDQTFTLENPSSATVSFRSRYDTLPVRCGLKMRMRDVDVETMEFVRDTYFVSGSFNMRFFFEEPIAGKDLIDSQIFLPIGCYGISRFGRISMSVAKPPLPGIGKLLELNWTNILDPDKIVVTRSTNNRNFYNWISFEYNKLPASGEYTTISNFLDTTSLNLFDQVSKLPIQAPGLTDDLGGATVANARGRALLTRYKNCALILELTVNWRVGSLIEVSDIVLLRDEGRLQIMNFETGERNLGVQLFEVIDRQYNIMAGNVKLKLLGGLGFSLDSRFGLFSPSSNLASGSTASTIKLKPSWGQTTLTGEITKWGRFVGQLVQVHDYEYTQVAEATFTGFNSTDPFALDLDPPLSFTPAEDYILDIPAYPTNTNRDDQATYKLLYGHLTPTIDVVSGLSETQFTVGAGDVGKFTVGNAVVVRSSDYTVISDEIDVEDITGTTITLEEGLGFTPDNTYKVEGIGYKDGQSYYRFT